MNYGNYVYKEKISASQENLSTNHTKKKDKGVANRAIKKRVGKVVQEKMFDVEQATETKWQRERNLSLPDLRKTAWEIEGSAVNKKLSEIQKEIGVIKSRVVGEAMETEQMLTKYERNVVDEEVPSPRKKHEMEKRLKTLEDQCNAESAHLDSVLRRVSKGESWSKARIKLNDLSANIKPQEDKKHPIKSEEVTFRFKGVEKKEKHTPEQSRKYASERLSKIVTEIDATVEGVGRVKSGINLLKNLRDNDSEISEKIEQYKKVEHELEKIKQKLIDKIDGLVKAKKVKNLNMDNSAKVNKIVDKIEAKLEPEENLEQRDEIIPSVLSEWKIKYEESLKLERELGLMNFRDKMIETTKISQHIDDVYDMFEINTQLAKLRRNPPEGGGLGAFIIRNNSQILEKIEDSLKGLIIEHIKEKKVS